MNEVSAGGVVFRRVNDEISILMIQDRFGKITLPKGKMEPNETIEQTALREILEETGIVGQIVELLETVEYQFTLPSEQVVDKTVHYYLIEANEQGTLKAQIEEIRGVEWCTPQRAWEQQTKHGYGNNDSVLKKALELLNCEV